MSPLEIKIKRLIQESYTPRYLVVGLKSFKAIQTLDDYEFYSDVHWYAGLQILTDMSNSDIIAVLEGE